MTHHHGPLDNMTNYWSSSSVKTNRSSLLSSQTEDPPFLAQSKSNYRPIPGTVAVPAALRSSPIHTAPTDEPALPNLETINVYSKLAHNTQSILTIIEDIVQADEEKPKRNIN